MPRTKLTTAVIVIDGEIMQWWRKADRSRGERRSDDGNLVKSKSKHAEYVALLRGDNGARG